MMRSRLDHKLCDLYIHEHVILIDKLNSERDRSLALTTITRSP